MNGIAISKFVGFFAVSKFLGNLYLSEQIFNRKRSLGAPDELKNEDEQHAKNLTPLSRCKYYSISFNQNNDDQNKAQ